MSSSSVPNRQAELSNKEIAEAIFVSAGTPKWHLHNVYGKFDVKNRSGAMSRAEPWAFSLSRVTEPKRRRLPPG